jgi:hypothetical protein
MSADFLCKSVIEKVVLSSGAEAHVRSVTGGEFAKLKSLGNDVDAVAEMLKLVVCNVNGQPILTDEILADIPQRTINELFNAATDVNLASKKAKEETRKN